MQPIIVKPDEGNKLLAFGDVVVFKIVGDQSDNGITIGHVLTPPGGGPPLHVHHREEEIFIMEAGDIEVRTEGRDWQKTPPGTVVFLPRDVPHQFRNAGETTSRHWVIATPSGFEGFYERAAAIFAKDGPPDMGQVLQAAADYGMEIVGPPPVAAH